MTFRLVSIPAMAALAVWAWPAPHALAYCSCVGGIDPGEVLVEDNGAISHRRKGIAWWSSAAHADEVVVQKRVRGEWVAAKFALEPWAVGGRDLPNFHVIEPKGGFKTGEQWRVFVAGRHDAVVARFHVLDRDVLRTGSPTLEVGAPSFREGLTLPAGASCSAQTDAVGAVVKVQLPTAWSSFRDQLLVDLRVDGKPWRPKSSLCSEPRPGTPWGDREGILVHASCGTPWHHGQPRGEGAYVPSLAGPRLSEGTHAVSATVYAPGTGRSWKLAPQDLTLACPAIKAPAPGGDGAPGTSAGGPTTEPPVVETPPENAPVSGSAPEPGPVNASVRGCSVSPGPGLGWAVWGVAILAWRRRRRR